MSNQRLISDPLKSNNPIVFIKCLSQQSEKHEESL